MIGLPASKVETRREATEKKRSLVLRRNSLATTMLSKEKYSPTTDNTHLHRTHKPSGREGNKRRRRRGCSRCSDYDVFQSIIYPKSKHEDRNSRVSSNESSKCRRPTFTTEDLHSVDLSSQRPPTPTAVLKGSWVDRLTGLCPLHSPLSPTFTSVSASVSLSLSLSVSVCL